MSMSRWDAAKKWLEVEGGWAVRWRLHALQPQVALFGRGLPTNWIIYRSSRTGWWKPAREPTARRPVRAGEEHEDYRPLLPFASELLDELRGRGALLVLTTVPSESTRVGHLGFFSRELGVPVVVPSLEGLATNDRSHLDRDSAALFTQRFWGAFVQLPEVRERLGPSRHAGSFHE
jgi:hypothetical protein